MRSAIITTYDRLIYLKRCALLFHVMPFVTDELILTVVLVTNDVTLIVVVDRVAPEPP